ncbi:PAS/PAC sensor hybrid histidine kinase [Cylindrospermum stagnale PCC 7417]|uniref:histidine kinase n=1 Tax=Cylindrospermum stagnale PCC 7417 TaxID=56107 RepID=K9WX65_9NOST|nr:PAS domain-containing sensor histidine kinase [Cylindrospermum stagnale]AFZ24077.1 PAS/PAC sensor hybrid histidine kinase [Cylindrospermum stagnale PCC 7417]
MTSENFELAITGAHQRLEDLLQRAGQGQGLSAEQNSSMDLLKEAIAEISISLEETQVLAEELQQQNQELLATRHLVEAERQRYLDLFNFAPEGYLVTDADGLIQEANYAAAQLLSVRQSYLIGKPLFVFVHQTERQKYRQIIQQLKEKGNIGPEELQLFHHQGRIDFPSELNALAIWDHEGKPSTLRWLFRDISQRQHTQQKLREQAALLDISTDAIFVKDLHNQILFWNKGAERIYGWQKQEAEGKNAGKLLSQKITPQLAKALETVVADGFWEGELHKLKKNGDPVIISSRWTLMLDDKGLPKSILTVDTDITEKKQLQAQLFRSQRLDSLGTLAGGIAHDFNNILTPIMTIAQLLPLKHPDLDESSQQMLKMLESNAKQGADLVRQILSFTRGSESKRTIVQAWYLIEDIKQIVKRTFSKSIDIKTEINANLGNIFGDSTQLHQVLMNLVVNARDAIPNGGNLRISANKLFIEQNYARKHIGAKVGFYVLITVADDGVGIRPDIIDKIFDPFFTTKEIGKGTGLGLSTVMAIVKSHGGFVEVSSQVGVGSQFNVYLPSCEESTSQMVLKTQMLAGQGELILVVDDEVSITQIIQTTLEIYNYKVLKAQNGIEALEVYNQHKDKIKLVLIDMMMPAMAGGTAIRTLQIINPQVQIIAMSGLASAEALARTTNIGIQGFLPKPFSADQLLKSVQKVLIPASEA